MPACAGPDAAAEALNTGPPRQTIAWLTTMPHDTCITPRPTNAALIRWAASRSTLISAGTYISKALNVASSSICNLRRSSSSLTKKCSSRSPGAGRSRKKASRYCASVNPHRDSTTHLSSTQHVHSYSLTTAHAAGPSKIGARCVSYVRSIFSSSKHAERP